MVWGFKNGSGRIVAHSYKAGADTAVHGLRAASVGTRQQRRIDWHLCGNSKEESPWLYCRQHGVILLDVMSPSRTSVARGPERRSGKCGPTFRRFVPHSENGPDGRTGSIRCSCRETPSVHERPKESPWKFEAKHRPGLDRTRAVSSGQRAALAPMPRPQRSAPGLTVR